MKEKNVNRRFRTSLLFSFLAILLLVIVGKAILLQVRPDPRLVQLAASKENYAERREQQTLLTSRGAIRDRHEKPLALSIIVKSFFANPKRIENPKQVARRLAPLLKMSASKLEETLKQDRYFVWLKREVDYRTAKKIESLNLQGIYTKKESKRVYPHKDLSRSVVGISGRDGVGLEGIEKSYDRYLKVKDEAEGLGIRDALGRLLLFGDFDKQWFDGADVILTLDLRLQKVLEEELQRTLLEKNAISAQGIMMNPKTGEIFAMASLDGKRAPKTLFRNRAVSDIYEPGSTFKIILATSGVEHLGMTSKSLIFGENGSLRIGNRTIREYNNRRFQWLTLQEVLEVSSNVAAAKLGLRLGEKRFNQTIQKLGMGSKTGIDLPGEASGLVRDSSQWRPIDLANISFGQGIAVTPIQMVRALAAIANGGYLVKPHLVKRVVEVNPEKQDKVFEFKPEIKEVMKVEEARELTKMLVEVTRKGATGNQASIAGFEVAGKTGTSQKLIRETKDNGKLKVYYSNDHSIVSFAGYVPAHDPEFVLLVLYDDPEGRTSGGNTAAPSFRKIAQKSLGLLGIQPVKERFVSSKMVKKVVEEGRFVGKSFQEVLQELKTWEEENQAYVNLVGTGTAVREEMDGSHLNVYFE